MRRKDNNDTVESRIIQLLSMAYDTDSTARVIAISNQILELDPDNPEALILKADRIKGEEKKIELLLSALDSLNKPENANYKDRDLFLLEVNEGLALMYFVRNKFHESFTYASEAMNILNDHEDLRDEIDGDGYFRSVYYRVMIELHEWQKILAESMRDEERNTAWAYSRLIAAYMLAPEHGRVYANMFWDMLRISPDMPFYMLGIYEEPDDDADSEEAEDFNFALMFYDTLDISQEFKNWFTRGVILFGLLTNRFDESEHDYMIDALDASGGYEEYEKMSRIIVEGDDEAVIEMLAANKCLTD
ncbi:MAG: hypothetical protein IJG34_03450 [Synergistaceae bacterium]|nr:hypothetical protein [Synergistaceae bacterium]MBQ3693894.1 hypothetical protein [Synergistaceae bacterium]MBQ6111528.1 hypothetical protein [Synergistaceae bacterium]MBQ9629405.1 hypothetical protein [Synergistaceae bacterium]MBR0250100.1 hypothetical protein [Synergistaceae bacterium]